MDAYLAARHIIETKGYRSYRFYTNGPGRQTITYSTSTCSSTSTGEVPENVVRPFPGSAPCFSTHLFHPQPTACPALHSPRPARPLIVPLHRSLALSRPPSE